jgi:prolyl-tRNA synthetase
LEEIQDGLYQKALKFRDAHTKRIDNKDDFYDFFTKENRGGFAYSHWNGKKEVEQKIKEDLSVTIRCIPLEGEAEEGRCVITGEKSKQRVIYSKAY